MNSRDYFLLFSPIVLGLGSAAFIEKRKIPMVNSPYNPPAWVFGLVWPILYLLLGHLFFLIVWWPIFVYYPNPFYSSITLFALTCSAIYLCYLYSKINIIAAYCLVPYILWLFFATFLSSKTQK